MPYPPLPHPPDPSALFNAPINEDAIPPFRLMVARFPGTGWEHSDCTGWLIRTALEMDKDDRISEVVPNRTADTPVTGSRNAAIMRAIREEIDYVLMIDSDMSPDCEPGAPGFWATAWDFMMSRRRRERRWSAEMIAGEEPHGHPDASFREAWWNLFAPATIAAPYCGPSPAQDVCVGRWLESAGSKHPDGRGTMTLIDRHDAARRSGIGRACSLATGLILYDVRTFFYTPAPWFDYEWTDGYMWRKASTEDIVQTRNAGILGMPQYVAWDCWAGHWKPQLVGKPRPLTIEVMNENLRHAVANRVTSREALEFRHPDDPNRGA